MGLFTQSSPFDAEVEKATSETNTNENWSLILDVCDKVSSNPRNTKDCLKAIMKRMNHADPHVVMQAITLLDACINNCGKPFHLEIASREFENEFRRLLAKMQPKVSLKMRQVLKKWAENDFKNDPELNLIPSLYMTLKQEGLDFSNIGESSSKATVAKTASALKDPNVVSSQQEEDDLAKAIELSLKEAKSSPKHLTTATAKSTTTYPSLYPSFGATSASSPPSSSANPTAATTVKQAELRKVRALYDFEAAEDNELTFFAGEIIHVIDDSDTNWWKGSNQRGEGLFPSNFVSADLSVDPDRLDINQQNKTKRSVQFENDTKELEQKTEAAAAAAANQLIEIDETKVDRLLHLLHEANPEDPSQDSEEMLRLEQEVHQMGPLIDAELERVDRKHAQLTQLSSDLVDAINMYHSLMRDDRAAGAAGAFLPAHMQHMLGQGSLNYGQQPPTNPQMAMYGPVGYPGALPLRGNFHQSPYNMNSMPPFMPNTGQPMPTMTNVNNAIPGAAGPYSGGAQHQPLPGVTMNRPQQPQQQQPQVPIQFQNGHVNSTPVNGGIGNTMTSAVTQPYPMLLSHQPPQQSFSSGSATANSAQQQAQQQEQSQQQQPQSSAPPPTPPLHQYMSPQHQQQTQVAQYIPQQQQQQPQLHYTATITNGPQQQQQQQHQQSMGYSMPQQQVVVPGAHQQSTSQQHIVNNNHIDQQTQQFRSQQQQQQHHQQQQQQLQRHLAAMSLNGTGGMDNVMGGVAGMAALGTNGAPGVMNQPITQSFLVQNEPKSNIPIFQQQR